VELQRARILDAMVAVIAERGYGGASVGSVCARAKVSRSTFYEVFPSFEECFLAVLDRGMETMAAVMLGALAGEDEQDWLDRMLATEAAVLTFLDGEPEFARVLLVDALGAGSWALERRQDNVGVLRDLIVEQFKDTPLGGDFPPMAAAGVMASLLGIMHEHLLHREAAPLISLLGPLMGVIMTPYLSRREVAREIRRGEEFAEKIQAERASQKSPFPSSGKDGKRIVEVPALLHRVRAERARSCVRYLAEQAECSHCPSNREIATGIGIESDGQISKLLARLDSAGIVSKVSHGPGRPNAWQLTPYGQNVVTALNTAEKIK
jgi:AcrR family transcriptional regulator